uniref:Uncharacterized protein n=1 Tax=Physcomitrium patens TaxID=3218 RepID=A0A2K1IYG9_PHYPA|nr:hypothetical protein PHYPA_024140 [Physcomitrium patens]
MSTGWWIPGLSRIRLWLATPSLVDYFVHPRKIRSNLPPCTRIWVIVVHYAMSGKIPLQVIATPRICDLLLHAS